MSADNPTPNLIQSPDRQVVYVKPMDVADLPSDVQDQADGLNRVFSVHNEAGEQLAIVADLQLAFHLAREHNYEPYTVH
ncbi:MAG: DUF1150 family protein [Pseudomonadota bacterium]